MTVGSSLGITAAVAAFSLWGRLSLAEGPERPRDPWVFRSVLDGRARMLTCELNKKLNVAYDTQTASLRRAWAGDVQFTGGVYDARHGPQPKSVGPAYFKAASDESPWVVGNGDKNVPTTPHYLGYRVGKSDVTIDYAFDTPGGGRATVSESPECETNGDRVTLVRTFTVNNLPDGLKITLRFEGDASDPPAEHALEGAAGNGPMTKPSGDLYFDHNGTYRLRTTWSTR